MNYKGIEISLTERTYRFTAVVNKTRVSKPSMLAMRRYIDSAQAPLFTPFDALIGGSGEPIVKVRVVSVEKLPPGRVPEEVMVSDKGEKYPALLKDTEQNRKLLAELEAYDKETHRIYRERSAYSESLEEKLSYVRAHEFFDGPAKRG